MRSKPVTTSNVFRALGKTNERLMSRINYLWTWEQSIGLSQKTRPRSGESINSVIAVRPTLCSVRWILDDESSEWGAAMTTWDEFIRRPDDGTRHWRTGNEGDSAATCSSFFFVGIVLKEDAARFACLAAICMRRSLKKKRSGWQKKLRRAKINENIKSGLGD